MEKIKELFTKELALYPLANLQDIYKLFYQDYFGPSHFVSDVKTAKEFIIKELESAEAEEPSSLMQEIICCNNFYRVDIRIIKNAGDLDEYADLFYSSSKLKLKSFSSWKEHWENIKQDLRESIPELLDDTVLVEKLDSIAENFQQVRHSSPYRDFYGPHYRIIDLELLQNSRFKGYLSPVQ